MVYQFGGLGSLSFHLALKGDRLLVCWGFRMQEMSEGSEATGGSEVESHTSSWSCGWKILLTKTKLALTKKIVIKEKMTATKHHVFSMFFNCDRQEKARAESMRENTLTHLTRSFENVAQFACIAKDENEDKPCLLLRGHDVSLNSPCAQPGRWLGKCCTCHPSNFGDIMNLCCLVCVDKQLVMVGGLSQVGNSNAKPFTTDPKFVVKILVDSMEGKSFECHQKV